MKVHELMGELALCVAGCDVSLCVGSELYEVDYVACCNHDGACCFVAAKPKAADAGDLVTVTVSKSQMLEAIDKESGHGRG